MQLSLLAEKYVRENGLHSRQIVSNCKRFERISGITDPRKISAKLLAAFREACLAVRLSAVTTEKTITDVVTILSLVTERPEIGKRLKQPRPKPNPATLSDLDAVFRAATSQRIRRWLAIAYWTGLRLADTVALYCSLSRPGNVIRHQAHKTGLNHCWPVPAWFTQWIPQVEPQTGYSTGWFAKLLRDELAETCLRAELPVITPKQIRQASITEWSRANATAGSIVHGCGLGVLAHYVDPLSVLESAAPRVRLPACFGACQSQGAEDTLLQYFRRLDPAAQSLITGTAERLAMG